MRIYIYTNMYRLLSRPAHGHPVALGTANPDAYLKHANLDLIIATAYMLQASCHVGTTDPKGEIEALTTRIMDIANETHE